MPNVPWQTELLNLLKAPQTPDNYRFLNQWATREHNGGPAMSDGSNNPFFTTAGGSGSAGPIKAGTFPTWNSVGVAKYPSLEVGVYANAAHITAGYPNILAALRSGNPASYASNQGFQADLTRWSGGGYSSFASIPAAAGPVGPTVDTGKLPNLVASALGMGSGWGSSSGGGVLGTINDGLRHIPGVAQVEGAVSGTVDAAQSVGGFLGKITDPHNILRGLQIIAGAGMVGIGVTLLARQVALAADLPDPVALVGGKTGAAVSAVANREARQAENAAIEANGGRAPRTSRERPLPRRTELTPDDPSARRAPRSSRPDAYDIPF